MDKQFTNYFTLNDKPIELTLDQLRYHNNYHAFSAHIPSLLPFLKPQKTTQLGMLQYPGTQDYDCLQYASAQLTYMPGAAKKEQQKVSDYLANYAANYDVYPWQPGPLKDSTLTGSVGSAVNDSEISEIPLVILGLGLGFHLEMLIKSNQFRYIVIYEAEFEFFVQSQYVIDWADLLEYCATQSISLFLQISQDGSDIYQNLNELQETLGFTDIALYKHFNTHVFDAIIYGLKSHGANGTEALALNHRLNEFTHPVPPLWQDSPISRWQTILGQDSSLFSDNMQALAIHFPDLYQEFSGYKPHFWHPVTNLDGVVNAANLTTETLLYSGDIDACANTNLEVFLRHPSAETLSIGYSHSKHEHYIQHRFTNKVQEVIATPTELGNSAMPLQISCLLLFGAGLGHVLPKLMSKRDIDHLFVCESQLDLFYCSLFTLDWQQILQSCIDKDVSLYLNIGQDGEQLLDDISAQSQKIGVHIMAKTYIYKPHYDPKLTHLFTELREHLKAQLVMSENLDHVMYGLAHTEYSIAKSIPYLLKSQNITLNPTRRDFPVFIVGNGPSLDTAITHIKANQAHAIVISCGTALKALVHNDIIPDYHAEIEQNRACYDWIAQSTSPEQRQQITLISCNGVHPDVVELFGQTKLVAKAGETSTALFFGKEPQSQYAFIQHAFPTVSNFTVNFVLAAGFKNIYLFGVDLGFKDKAHHHSKYSAYYQQAQDVSNFTQQEYGDQRLPGNFCESVQTKYEFKIARRHMQTCISHFTAEVFNLSDGARIDGTYPLRFEDLLVLPNDKFNVKTEFENTCFAISQLQPYLDNYLALKSHPNIAAEINALRIRGRQLQSHSDVVALCDELRAVLFTSLRQQQTLTFYLFNSIVHTFCALLMGNINACCEPEQLATLSQYWDECVDEILQHLTLGFDYDYSCADIYTRSHAVLAERTHKHHVAVINHERGLSETELDGYCCAIRDTCSTFLISTGDSVDITDRVSSEDTRIQVHIALSGVSNADDPTEFLTWLDSLAMASPDTTMFVITHEQHIDLHEVPQNICLVVIPRYQSHHSKSEYTLAYTLQYLPFVLYNSVQAAAVMFKYYPYPDDAMSLEHEILTSSTLPIYHSRLYVAVLRETLNVNARVTTNGCRLTPIRTQYAVGLLQLGRAMNAPGSSQYQVEKELDDCACG